jgi:hypothetical protein
MRPPNLVMLRRDIEEPILSESIMEARPDTSAAAVTLKPEPMRLQERSDMQLPRLT